MVGTTYYLGTSIISGVPMTVSAAPLLSSLGISMLGAPVAPAVPLVGTAAGAGAIGTIGASVTASGAALGSIVVALLSVIITSSGIIAAIPIMCGGMSMALLNILTCGVAGTISESLTSIPFMGALLGSVGMGGGDEMLFFMP